MLIHKKLLTVDTSGIGNVGNGVVLGRHIFAYTSPHVYCLNLPPA